MGTYEKIGFIGSGNMAEAIASALIEKRIFDKDNILMSDISEERLSYIQQTYGVETASDNKALVKECDIIILSVKPQVMDTVIEGFSGNFCTGKRKLFISIAAGIRSERIEKIIYKNLEDDEREITPLIRVMPNTPCMVFSGMSAMSCNRFCNKKDMDITRLILESMGKVIKVEEDEIDAVTAMSGSGPAYVFYFIESMIKAGVDMGFSEDIAGILTLETIKGAVKLMEESGEAPDVLRKKVTSKGGTTEAALNTMEDKGVKESIIEAVKAAQRRSVELSG